MANIVVYGKDLNGTAGRHRTVAPTDTVTDSGGGPAIQAEAKGITSYNAFWGGNVGAGFNLNVNHIASASIGTGTAREEITIPVAGNINRAVTLVQTADDTVEGIQQEINSSLGTVFPTRFSMVTHSGYNEGLSAGDGLTVASTYASGNSLCSVAIQPSNPSEQGYILPFGANISSVGLFALAWGSPATSNSSTEALTTLIVPVDGSIEVVAWSQASNSNATMKLWLNGVEDDTFTASGLSGIDTSVSIAVSAGDEIRLEYDAGATAPGNSSWMVYVITNDGNGAHLYGFGGDGAAGNLTPIGSPGDVPSGSLNPNIRWLVIESGTLDSVSIHRETSASDGVYTVNINDRISIPVTITSGNTDIIVTDIDVKVTEGEFMEVTQSGDFDDTIVQVTIR